MNRGPASLHRLSVALIALLAILVGVAMILHRTVVDPVARWIDDFDPDAVTRFTDSGWWVLVLLGIAVLALIWGWSLLGTTVRPGRAPDVHLAGSGPEGDLRVAPKLIASAAEEELAGQKILSEASVTATNDRGRSIIRIVVRAKPIHSYTDVLAALTPTLEDLRRAVAGSDVHVQALVHLE